MEAQPASSSLAAKDSYRPPIVHGTMKKVMLFIGWKFIMEQIIESNGHALTK